MLEALRQQATFAHVVADLMTPSAGLAAGVVSLLGVAALTTLVRRWRGVSPWPVRSS
jgi:hypothetical protein